MEQVHLEKKTAGISALVCPMISELPVVNHTIKNVTFVSGAGYYLKATTPGFSKHYNMEDFILEELPNILQALDLPLAS